MKIRKLQWPRPDVLTAGFLFLLTMDIYFPGLMSHDSVLQLTQAATGLYNDSHPPLMALVWSFLNHIHFGPVGMLALQNIIFWVALVLLGRLLFKGNRERILLLIFFGFYPAIFVQLGVIWKDTGVSVSLFMAAAILLYASQNQLKKRGYLFLTFPLFFYAMGVRHDALIAVSLMIAWWATLYFSNKRRVIQAFAAISVTFIIFFANHWLADVLVQGKHGYAFQGIQVFDLTSISVQENTLLVPDYLREENSLTLAQVKALYRPADLEQWYWPPPHQGWTQDPVHIQELNIYWKDIVRRYPKDYVLHRLTYFENFLGVVGAEACTPFETSIEPNQYGIRFHSNWIWRGYFDIIRKFQNGFLFRGIIYFILSFIFLIFSLRNFRQRAPYFWLSLSALAYTSGYLLYGSSCEFRYFYWPVLSSCLCLVLFISEIYVRRTLTQSSGS